MSENFRAFCEAVNLQTPIVFRDMVAFWSWAL